MPDNPEDRQDEPQSASSGPYLPPLPGIDRIPHEITLRNGIKLRLRTFPRLVLRKALERVRDPEVPVVEFEDGSKEENPLDPAYAAAFEKVHEERLEVASKIFLAYGLEVAHVPEGLQKPEDDEWITDLAALGVTVPSEDLATPRLRFHAWLDYYALDDDEKTLAWLIAQQATGILESEVIAAMRFFQDLGARRARDRRAAAETEAGEIG